MRRKAEGVGAGQVRKDVWRMKDEGVNEGREKMRNGNSMNEK